MALKYSKNNGKEMYLFTAVFGVILFLVSSSVLPFLSDSKNVPSPDLFLCLVCAMSAYLPKKTACIFAVVFGLFADLFLYAPTSFSPIIYVVSVFITCICLSHFSALGSVIMAVCSVPAILFRSITKMIAATAVFEGANFFSLLRNNFVHEIAVTFASAIVICFICRRLIYKFKTNFLH